MWNTYLCHSVIFVRARNIFRAHFLLTICYGILYEKTLILRNDALGIMIVCKMGVIQIPWSKLKVVVFVMACQL